MTKFVERKSPHSTSPKYARWLKRQMARLRRRLWRERGEDAPVKVRELTRGSSL